ncbi:hypothetical protein ACU4GI_19600 [Cupriavidus basilensis]
MKRMKFSALALVATLTATTLVAHAQSQPGITDKNIKIGMFSPMSGPSMSYGFDVINAARMWYDKVNKEGASTVAKSKWCLRMIVATPMTS